MFVFCFEMGMILEWVETFGLDCGKVFVFKTLEFKLADLFPSSRLISTSSSSISIFGSIRALSMQKAFSLSVGILL